jgi:hypothetical protein
MWILKGLLSGSVVFLIFTVYYLKSVIGPSKSGHAIGVSVITSTTIQQPMYWLTFLLVLFAAVMCARLLQQFT